MKNSYKNLLILLLLLAWNPFHGHAQGTQTEVKPIPKQVDTADLFTNLDGYNENPEYPGGMVGFNQFLVNNIRYPRKAIDAGAQGTVYVSMVVRKDGSIDFIKIKLDKVGHGCGEEAVRVIKLMRKWNPGKMNGIPMNVRYTVPVKFVLH